MLLKLNARLNVVSKKPVYYDDTSVSDPGTSVFKIAYKIGNKKMMSLIMKFIS